MIDYDPHTWRSHLWDIRGSMVREIAPRVLVVVAFSTGVVTAHKGGHPVAIPPTVHTLVGLALGLLLVFRTNASYDRFWEGRKQWGAIVNESRNLARSARTLLGAETALLRSIVSWTAAFPYATMHALRGTPVELPQSLGLPPAEAASIVAAQHVPLAVATRISAALVEARRRNLVSDYVHLSLDQNVQLLVDYMGACERIHKTPMPFAYMVHLRRALILYCFSLPFALVEAFGWWAVAGTLILAYTLYGIEEIGVEIEDPFGTDDNDLPLEQICSTIEKNVMSFLENSAEPTAAPARPSVPASPS